MVRLKGAGHRRSQSWCYCFFYLEERCWLWRNSGCQGPIYKNAARRFKARRLCCNGFRTFTKYHQYWVSRVSTNRYWVCTCVEMLCNLCTTTPYWPLRVIQEPKFCDRTAMNRWTARQSSFCHQIYVRQQIRFLLDPNKQLSLMLACIPNSLPRSFDRNLFGHIF